MDYLEALRNLGKFRSSSLPLQINAKRGIDRNKLVDPSRLHLP